MNYSIKKADILGTGYGELVNFDSEATGACIDSRILQSGEIFFALKGEKTDGHNFLLDALNRGAALAVVEKEWYQDSDEQLKDSPLWIVPDTSHALRLLAKQWRQHFEIPVIAITGSSGKTTTRDLTAHLLSSKYRIHVAEKNYNNQLGVPLTLLKLNPDHELAILELGANHLGEITELAIISRPTHGLITNIGMAHIGEFGGFELIRMAKGELFEALISPAVKFVNQGDKEIAALARGMENIITYALDQKGTDYQGKILEFQQDGHPVMQVNDSDIFVAPLPGYSGALNTLAALTIADSFGVSLNKAIQKLKEFQPVTGRFQLLTVGKFQLIDDTYNANPDSTIDSIRTLSLFQVKGKRVVVLGDMLELGEWTKEGHERVAAACEKYKIDLVLLHGNLVRYIHNYLQKKGQVKSHFFYNLKELVSFIQNNLHEKDLILVKGSRGSRMERVIKGLES